MVMPEISISSETNNLLYTDLTLLEGYTNRILGN